MLKSTGIRRHQRGNDSTSSQSQLQSQLQSQAAATGTTFTATTTTTTSTRTRGRPAKPDSEIETTIATITQPRTKTRSRPSSPAWCRSKNQRSALLFAGMTVALIGVMTWSKTMIVTFDDYPPLDVAQMVDASTNARTSSATTSTPRTSMRPHLSTDAASGKSTPVLSDTGGTGSAHGNGNRHGNDIAASAITSLPGPADDSTPEQRYKNKVQKAIDVSPRLDKQCSANQAIKSVLPTLVQSAFGCLSKTPSSLTPESMVYPINDAHAHFNEIRMALSKWAQHDNHTCHRGEDYFGPWIENYYISRFEGMYDKRIDATMVSPALDASPQFCLHELFGPYIPIFIPWTDHVLDRDTQDEQHLKSVLLPMLRPEVPYVIVVQHKDGLLPRTLDWPVEGIPNILILSSGGHGHIPIPLFKQPEAPVIYEHESANDGASPTKSSNAVAIPSHETQPQFRKHPKDREYITSYVGRPRNAPMKMRRLLLNRMQRLDEDEGAKAINNSTMQMFTYKFTDSWRSVVAESCFSFCPRGLGRTAYHVMEVLQMGFIPIHVYMDVPWMPYIDLMRREQMAIIVRHGFVDKLMREQLLVSLSLPSSQTSNWTFDKIEQVEQRIRAHRDSHFSFKGVAQQIGAFLLDPSKSDLRCQAMPSARNFDLQQFEREKHTNPG